MSEFKSKMTNCYVAGRPEDGPIIFADKDGIKVNIDRYAVIPLEKWDDEQTRQNMKEAFEQLHWEAEKL